MSNPITTDDLYKQATSANTNDLWNQATAKPPSVLDSVGAGVKNALTNDPITGPIADYVFDEGFYKKILGAFGQSFQQNYGLKGIDPDFEKQLKSLGVFDDYKDGKVHTLKQANEAWMRPVIAAGTAAYAGVAAVGSATLAAGQELGHKAQEIQSAVPGSIGTALATPLGAAGELVASLPQGFLPELHIPELHAARSEAVIGEGESGYFGTQPPSPEETVARSEAIRQTSADQPLPQPDLHTVARQIAPDTFAGYDESIRQRDALRAQLDTLRQNQPINPRQTELQNQIDTILGKVAGDESRLTKTAAERLQRVQTELDSTGPVVETPEMASLREKLLTEDYRLRDLAPDVATAYRIASEQAITDAGEPVDGVSEQVPSQIPDNLPAVPEGSVRFYHGGSLPTQTGETRWVSPDFSYARDYRSSGDPNKVFYVDIPKDDPAAVKARLWDEIDEAGETNAVGRHQATELPAEWASKLKPVESEQTSLKPIIDDVRNKLSKAGRSNPEEIEAAAQIVAAYYDTRAKRFQGKLGSGLELYNREAPDVIKGDTGSKAGTHNQYGGLKSISADERQFKVAHHMLDAGIDPEKIRLATGWFKSSLDNEWRFEISDKEASFKPEWNDLPENKFTTLGSVLEHSDLFKHYPQLADYKFIKFGKEGFKGYKDLNGAFSLREKLIGVSSEAENPLTTLIHEVQHAVQDIEGFTKETNYTDPFQSSREIEARDVAARQDYSSAVRKDVKPYSSENILNQTHRGSIEITPEKARNVIRLFKDADASTFMHEMSHQFLEDLRSDARHKEAPADLILDSAIVHRWLRAKPNKSLTGAQHERFAGGFERYLMEGRAPSKELAGVFARFKNWLIQIYKTVSNIRNSKTGTSIKINDDIRDVFARFLSNDPDYRGVTVVPDEEPAVAPEPVDVGVVPVNKDLLPKQPEGTPATANSSLTYNQSDYVDKAGKINFNAITSDETMQNFLKAWASQNNNFVRSRGLGLTKSDIIEAAEIFGTTARNMSRNLEKLKKLTVDSPIPLAVRVKALEAYLRQNTDNLMKAAAEDNPYEMAGATLRQLDAMRTFTGVQTSWSQVGLALKSIKVEAKQGELINELLQSSVGRSLEELHTDMARIRQLDTPAKVNAYIKAMVKPSLGEMLEEFFKNNLISGPLTHLQYTIGNKIFAFLQAGPESFVASKIADYREWKTGKESEPGQRVYPGEAGQGLYSFLFGQRDGLKAMWDSFKAGQTLPLPGEGGIASTPFTATKSIPDFKNVLGTGINIPLGSALRAPGERMVAPIHSADRTVNFLVGRSMFSYRMAVDEGLQPGTTAFASRQAELQNNPTPELIKQSVDYATEAALMGRSGNLVRRVQNLINWEPELLQRTPLGRTKPLKFIAPFVSVNGNILRKALMERTPIGFFSEDASGRNGTLAQDTARARATVGTAIWGTMAGLYMQGMIQPSAPDDYKEAAIHKMANGLPNSIRIGDISYAFDRLGVFGAQLAIGADIMHAVHNGYENPDVVAGIEQAGSELFFSLLHHVMSEGFLSGVADTMKAVDEHERYGANWVKNFISSGFVPYGIFQTQISQQIDPYSRKAKTFMDSIKARIPFLSETLPTKIDIFGNPVPNREFWGVYASQVSNDPVLTALQDAGYFPSPVSQKIRGIDLTPEQYTAYASQSGILLHQQLQAIVNMPQFSSLLPGLKHELIKNAITQSRETAAATTMAHWPDIMKQAIANKQQLITGTGP